jgi:SUF system NifU family Fe-S assembly protein
MKNLDNLYREVIMEHYKNPRHQGLEESSDYQNVRIKNPSCGDDVVISVKVKDQIITDCLQLAKGCSISVASASVMTDIVVGKTVDEALNIAENFLKMVSNQTYDEAIDFEEAEVFSGVNKFPARIKCASIAWVAFKEALLEKRGEQA